MVLNFSGTRNGDNDTNTRPHHLVFTTFDKSYRTIWWQGSPKTRYSLRQNMRTLTWLFSAL